MKNEILNFACCSLKIIRYFTILLSLLSRSLQLALHGNKIKRKDKAQIDVSSSRTSSYMLAERDQTLSPTPVRTKPLFIRHWSTLIKTKVRKHHTHNHSNIHS
jgi:hypothetical protein